MWPVAGSCCVQGPAPAGAEQPGSSLGNGVRGFPWILLYILGVGMREERLAGCGRVFGEAVQSLM